MWFNRSMKFPFKKVALIGKYKAPEIAEPLLLLAGFLSSRGLSVVVDSLTSEHLKSSQYPMMSLEEIGRVVDLAIVLGGDGTMLNIARILSPCHIPLVGVNQGRLGFLTDLSLENMQESIAAMLEGKFVTEQRLLLSARVLRNNVEVFSGLAFNDVVIHRGSISSMIEFEVRIDGEYLYNQRADGLIVSTPTGSTAYAMSAGGPILHPSLDAIELVPVCPHTLSNRPIVVKGTSVLEILPRRTGDLRVRFDSHTNYDLQLHDKIIVARHPETACLLHPVGHSYYHTLREKLLWNQTP
jgi:NAD+ kinase